MIEQGAHLGRPSQIDVSIASEQITVKGSVYFNY
jgi:predicted PhzF superfamily epimerase YddE/YHI9